MLKLNKETLIEPKRGKIFPYKVISPMQAVWARL